MSAEVEHGPWWGLKSPITPITCWRLCFSTACCFCWASRRRSLLFLMVSFSICRCLSRSEEDFLAESLSSSVCSSVGFRASHDETDLFRFSIFIVEWRWRLELRLLKLKREKSRSAKHSSLTRFVMWECFSFSYSAGSWTLKYLPLDRKSASWRSVTAIKPPHTFWSGAFTVAFFSSPMASNDKNVYIVMEVDLWEEGLKICLQSWSRILLPLSQEFKHSPNMNVEVQVVHRTTKGTPVWTCKHV